MHINVHALNHIYTRGGERNVYIYISGDSSPICKRHLAGVDPEFQVKGGGGGALKKIAPSGVRRKIFWGISCEK